ncbi:hypothetical protein FGO68_gene5227 [Halteria grandinella]|uniref:Uncharacterized protein n=1 Tax=Halteria grandinella TaxID=5974 RepID=A0A8J8NEX8_HALGN|nr:hypothetical protein FGO68_gene5227 [Halteria grandinella]
MALSTSASWSRSKLHSFLSRSQKFRVFMGQQMVARLLVQSKLPQMRKNCLNTSMGVCISLWQLLTMNIMSTYSAQVAMHAAYEPRKQLSQVNQALSKMILFFNSSSLPTRLHT